jgi:uncharacterized Zn-finger protein
MRSMAIMPRNSPPLNPEPHMTSAPTVETFHVDDRTVACDGGPLGHPRVFLRITDREVTCPYCSRHYILNAGAGHDTGH